ncbi:cupin domain-containing protein [Salegentibacter sediminis]|uniref:cupin domain-containing protein n=1 Tax=Salegentibacter sediminis TaxID=1930251 RepID=UPI0009BE0104|nr:cupin domain-containing protein [Salegentibacter sediminis]
MKTFFQSFKTKILLLSFIFLSTVTLFAQEPFEDSVVITKTDNNLQWGACPDFMPAGCEIAVLHGDPGKMNADVFFKVPANTLIPNHKHTSAERMVLVSGELEVTYKGEDSQILREGSYAYGPAKKPHSAKCGDLPCVLFIAFEEPVDAFAVEE